MHSFRTFAGPALSLALICLSPAPSAIADPSSDHVTLVGQLGGTTSALATEGNYLYFSIGPRLAVLDLRTPVAAPVARSAPLPSWIAGIAVANGYAYVAAADSGFRILDVSNLSAIVEVGAAEFRGNAEAVAVDGTWAFVADSIGGLRIFDVTDVHAPIQVAFVETEGEPNHIFIHDQIAYLSDGFAGVRIFNVSDPTIPVEIAILDTPGFAEFCVVEGGFAYIADRFSGLRIADVSDPSAPATLGAFDTSGFGFSVAVLGTYAYIADGDRGVRVVDVTNPFALSEVGDFQTPASPAYTNAVLAAGGRIYVADGDRGLHALNVTNPASPSLLASFGELGFIQEAAVSGQYAYVAGDTAGLWIVDRSDGDLRVVSLLDTPGVALDVDVVDGYAFIADGFGGLRIANVTNPAAPSEVASYDTAGFASAVTVTGGRAYVVNSSGGVVILDIEDPAHPTYVSRLLTQDTATCVEISGNIAFVCASTAGLRIFDLSTETSPVEVGSFVPNETTVQAVAVSEGYAFLGVPNVGLTILNVTTPATPVQVAEMALEGFVFDVKVKDGFAYLASGASGLQVINIQNPSAPYRAGSFNTAANAWRVDLASNDIFVSDHGGGLYLLAFDGGPARPPVGGGSFGIQFSDEVDNVTVLTWLPGQTDSDFLMYRMATTTQTATLAAVSTENYYVDATPLTEAMYCYWALPYSDGQILGRSDYLCAAPNSKTGVLHATEFTLRLNQSVVANVTWKPVPQADAYVLIAVPSDNSARRLWLLPPDESIVHDDTRGVPTCYTVLTIRGEEIGTSHVLCAIPGASQQ
ncbi:MAG TPA: PQQ-binding-like beta-propeller repeat protein [Vicinamibacterales bacterium]|nr:PQQ-binding-like beta-propeller repeat protein [Vicinamibacterales bacterium]